MFTSLLRYLRAWRQYQGTVWYLSNLGFRRLGNAKPAEGNRRA